MPEIKSEEEVCYEALMQYAKNGLKVLERIDEAKTLQVYKKLVNRKDGNQMSALHYAARGHFTPQIETFLNKLQAKVDIGNNLQQTPLMMACKKEADNDLERYYSSNPDLRCATDSREDYIRSYEAWKDFFDGHNEVVCETVNKLINNGSAWDAKDSSQKTAMHYAAKFEQIPQLCQLILQNKNKKPFNMTDMEGKTPFQIAISRGHVQAAIMLAPFSDITKRDASNATSLISAAASGHETVMLICSIMEKYYPENLKALLSAKDDDGQNALMVALKSAKFYSAQFLKKIDPDLRLQDKNLQGQNCLHLAVSSRNNSCVNLLMQDFNMLNTPDNKGNLPIHIATKVNAVSVIEILVKKSQPADLGIPNRAGMNALMCAMENNQTEAMEAIMKHCPNQLNDVDKQFRTALLIGVQNNSIECLRSFFKNSTNLNINRRDATGRGPIATAAANGHIEIVK
ncbi:hypothetical protein Ciccas_011578, partial [Cichlidogyrus casuarinus]